MRARVQYDIDTMRNWSLVFDLMIIGKTLAVVWRDQTPTDSSVRPAVVAGTFLGPSRCPVLIPPWFGSRCRVPLPCARSSRTDDGFARLCPRTLSAHQKN